MPKSLIDCLPLKPETRNALARLDSPARTWAIAKAAFETAHESNFAEQRAAVAAATVDDPEPPEPFKAPRSNAIGRNLWLAWLTKWEAWFDRTCAVREAATKPISDRYPRELEQLAKFAEVNLVLDTETKLRARDPKRFAQIKPAFDAYRDHRLYGDQLQQFLTICFNCPRS